MRQLITILTLAFFISCNSSTKDEKGENAKKDTIANKINAIVDQDVITTACAIVISPTDLKIDSLKKVYKDDFYTIADDNSFYVATATSYLDSVKTKIIYKKSVGVIKFKGTNGVSEEINLNESLWEILLFNGKTEPIEANLTNFISDYNRYMKMK